MDIKYKITNEILNNILNFGILYERLNHGIQDAYWQKRLVEIVRNENAIAAVSLNKKVSSRWALKPSLKIIKTLLPEESIPYHKNYEAVLQQIEKSYISSNIDIELIKEIHAQLISTGDNKADSVKNKFRKEARVFEKYIEENNIVRKISYEIKTAAGEVDAALKELLEWLNMNGDILNPLILAGIYHLKLAFIHPYNDGNGRLARITEKILLSQKGFLTRYMMLEDYYLINSEEYYSLIENTIESGDLTKWLEFYTLGLNKSITQTIEILKVLTGGAIDLEKNVVMQLSDREKEVIEIFNLEGQASASEIGRVLEVTRQTASVMLRNLHDLGLLDKVGSSTSLRYRLKADDQRTLHVIIP